MNKITKESRIAQLKAMHEVMINANDESIYVSWISCGVPDCPQEDDFEFIAEDNEEYNEVVDLFVELIQRKGYRS